MQFHFIWQFHARLFILHSPPLWIAFRSRCCWNVLTGAQIWQLCCWNCRGIWKLLRTISLKCEERISPIFGLIWVKNIITNIQCPVEHKGSLKKLLPWKSKIHSDIWKGTQSWIKVLWWEKVASLRLFFPDEQFIHIRHSTIQMSDWMKIWSWTFMIMEQIIGHTPNKKLGIEVWTSNWRPFWHVQDSNYIKYIALSPLNIVKLYKVYRLDIRMGWVGITVTS